MLKLPKVKLLSGSHPDIVNSNVQMLKDAGLSHNHATHLALKHSAKMKKNFGKHINEITSKVAKKPEMPKVNLMPTMDLPDENEE